MTISIERIKQLMREQGLTNKDLAEEGIINKNTIRNWEKGIKPQYASVLALANRLGVTIDYLYCETDQRTASVEDLQGIEFALLTAFRNLTENQKQDVIDYMYFKTKQEEEK